MDTQIASIFIFSFGCLIMGIVFLSYSSKQTATHYNNSLNLVNAKCVLVCRHMNGIPDFKQNESCYLLADDEKITIIPINNTTIQFSIYLTQLRLFKHTRTNISGELAGSNLPGINNIIEVSYISENDQIKQLTFSLVLTSGEVKFNRYAVSKCNINEFINARIPKPETTIEL